MQIENEIFKRTNIDFNKLIDYGFIKGNQEYIYKKEILDNLEVQIYINENKSVTGKVIDTITHEEYTNFRLENRGSFSNQVKEEYTNILKDIALKCTTKKYFITPQANRITNLLINLYHNEPEFPWASSPGSGIFRNPKNKKWYGLIMNIDKSKIDKNCKGEIEVINIKLDDKEILDLLNRKGFYKAYHMNKKYWISIILDETLSDDEILSLIKESHQFTEI